MRAAIRAIARTSAVDRKAEKPTAKTPRRQDFAKKCPVYSPFALALRLGAFAVKILGAMPIALGRQCGAVWSKIKTLCAFRRSGTPKVGAKNLHILN
jgi:hypothetical protein